MYDIRDKLEQLVSAEYHVPFEELANSLHIEIKNDRLSFEDLSSLTLDQLKDVMLASLSWSDFINTRVHLMKSLQNQQNFNLSKKKASVKIDYINQHSGNRGSKAMADLYAEANEDLINLEKKINNYKIYTEYLEDFVKLLESLHYTAKSLYTTPNKQI